KVVVAVDASEESLHALSWALDHVVRLHPGASVVVVHAQHRVDRSAYAGLAYVPPTAMDAMRRTQAENTRKVVSRALDVCKQKQASATAVLVVGDAKEAICQAVEDMRADLLVLGSRGLGMVRRYVRAHRHGLPHRSNKSTVFVTLCSWCVAERCWAA
uniref:UspA domain-containing protein n=1 Tax=Aegilops tauschii subsp. strangulata TaxID=200361 RepID=A0A453LTT1_AEGTS